MKTTTAEQDNQLLSDVKGFAGLEGAQDVQFEDGVITYIKRRSLYNFTTRCTVTVKERENKRTGSISYRVTTTHTNVDGRTIKQCGVAEYNFEGLYHTITAHCRHILA